jgi:hypothetical protein
LEDLRLDGKIILIWILNEYSGEGVDRINMAQNKEKWGVGAAVNTN